MKVLVLGFLRMNGKAKAPPHRPYDFAQLIVANPITPHTGENMNRQGQGFEAATIDLQLGCEGQFNGLKFPTVLELKMDHQLGRQGRMEAVCVGFVAAGAPPVRAAG